MVMVVMVERRLAGADGWMDGYRYISDACNSGEVTTKTTGGG